MGRWRRENSKWLDLVENSINRSSFLCVAIVFHLCYSPSQTSQLFVLRLCWSVLPFFRWYHSSSAPRLQKPNIHKVKIQNGPIGLKMVSIGSASFMLVCSATFFLSATPSPIPGGKTHSYTRVAE